MAKAAQTGSGFFAGAFGQFFGQALQSLIPLIGPMLTPLFNWLGGLFDRHKGRDSVVAFAAEMGGFDALHAKLLEVGAAGEAAWVKLTQGTPSGNKDVAAQNIQMVIDLLNKQKVAGDATVDGLTNDLAGLPAKAAGAAAGVSGAFNGMLTAAELAAKGIGDAFNGIPTGFKNPNGGHGTSGNTGVTGGGIVPDGWQGHTGTGINGIPSGGSGVIPGAMDVGGGTSTGILGPDYWKRQWERNNPGQPYPGDAWLWDDIRKQVPQMAAGGYVRARPGGTLVNVGEGGEDEVVTPASQMGGLTVNIYGDIDSEARARRVVEDFTRIVSQGGRHRTMALNAVSR
jgi:hypothetical protein